MKIIDSAEFDTYWKDIAGRGEDEAVLAAVRGIVEEVRRGGDEALRGLSKRFEKSVPERFEVAAETVEAAWERMKRGEPELAGALETARRHIEGFALEQRRQFADFETEVCAGVFAGQRIIPVQKVAVYAPAGRFPLISSVLMGVIPARVAGVREVYVASPPVENGLPDPRIMAAARLAGASRVFAIGGAQAIAALAIGTETVPRVDVIAGPGNKYVATAKRLLFGEVGIDFVAGPTDVLVVAGEGADPDTIAADMLAQAEHDGDARARALVPSRGMAAAIEAAIEKRLAGLSTAATARTSLDSGGLIVVYSGKAEAVRIADTIAPEHLELQGQEVETWPTDFTNFGALFIGEGAAEVLGDYSAGTNHTLPTSGSARFTGGLSVRHFLKTVTTLRCVKTGDPASGVDGGAVDDGYAQTVRAAEIIAEAEGLIAHKESAAKRA